MDEHTLITGPMPTLSEQQRLTRALHRVRELEADNAFLRQRYGEDTKRIRELEDQLRRLKAEVARQAQ